MRHFQRIKDILSCVGMLAVALVMLIIPEDGYFIIITSLTLSLIAYGFRLLWYYFRMARHMVGGKITLYQAIIVLDLAMFSSSMVSMSSVTIVIYLLSIFAVSGFVDILRAGEAKRLNAPGWKLKLFGGIISVLFSLTLVIIGLFFDNTEFLVYVYCISLVYRAALKLVSAFRKTTFVYIQ